MPDFCENMILNVDEWMSSTTATEPFSHADNIRQLEAEFSGHEAGYVRAHYLEWVRRVTGRTPEVE